MVIKAVTCGIIGTNSFVIIEGNECILIDPAEYSAIKMMLDIDNLTVRAILLTHGHFDHIACVSEFISRGIPVYIHEGDVAKCNGKDMPEKLRQFGVKPFEPTNILKGGETPDIIGLKFKVIHTPGHSKGSVCYVLGDNIFCGDTILSGGYGRYDFYDGSLSEIKESIAKLFALEGDYTLFSGHGYNSTLEQERLGNMILWS